MTTVGSKAKYQGALDSLVARSFLLPAELSQLGTRSSNGIWLSIEVESIFSPFSSSVRPFRMLIFDRSNKKKPWNSSWNTQLVKTLIWMLEMIMVELHLWTLALRDTCKLSNYCVCYLPISRICYFLHWKPFLWIIYLLRWQSEYWKRPVPPGFWPSIDILRYWSGSHCE